MSSRKRRNPTPRPQETPKDPVMSRRAFLWSAATGGAALLTGSLIWHFDKPDDVEPAVKTPPAPPKAPTPVVNDSMTQADVNELYAQIRENLRMALEDAKATGQTPLIVLGEDHASKQSTLLEMMFVRALNELDPKGAGANLVVEMQQREFRDIISKYDMLPESGIPGKTATSIYAKHRRDMNVVAADLDHYVNQVEALRQQGRLDEAEQRLNDTCEERDTHIATTAKNRMPQGGAVIVGLVHMRGVINGFKQNHPNAPVLAINVSSIQTPATFTEGHGQYMTDSLEFATSSPYVNQLSLGRKVTMPIYAMPDMIEHAVEKLPETIQKMQQAQQGQRVR